MTTIIDDGEEIPELNFTPEVIDEIIPKTDDTINENQICSPFKTLNIQKIIIKQTDDSPDIKLIFIGSRSTTIQDILTKIEKNEKLNKTEINTLNNEIPYWDKKIGSLDNITIKFIYKSLEDNITINQFSIILYTTIKDIFNLSNERSIDFLPKNMLIYKYNRVIEYEYFIDLLNFIFEDNENISNDTFIQRIFKITLLEKKELINLAKDKLPNHNLNTIEEFFNNSTYEYVSMLNNEILFHILYSIPVIVNCQHIYNIKDKKYKYYGYQYIDQIINLSKSGCLR
jgi:hypothetical protein